MEDTTTYCVSSSGEGCFVLTPEKLPNSVFNELRKSEELVDVHLQVGNKQLAAHRVVLAATIPYFRTMFTIEMRERIEHVITIEEASIDESTFEAIVDYAYGAQICITSLNLPSLFVAASFFQLDRLSKACCQIVKSTLKVSNVLEIYTLGDTLGHLCLVDSAQTFIRKHFEEFAESESFLSLSSDTIIGIISKDELNVTNEKKVFEAAIKWVKWNKNTRKDNLPQLLLHVRLPLMTPDYLTDCVFTEELVRNSHSCRDLLEEALIYHLMPNKRHLLKSVITTPRCSADAGLIYVVGGRNVGRVTVNIVEVYNDKLSNWRMETAMTSSRAGLAVAVLDRKIYAIGGYDSTCNQYLSSVEVFDASAKRWTNATSMNCKRGFTAAATLNDKLYVCGGWDGSSRFNTVECYDHKKDEWQMMPCMSTQRCALAVVAFQGSIVALGGFSDEATDSVEMFDPKTQRWTGMPSMLLKRRGLGAAVFRNKIYVCGGQDVSNRRAEVFDPDSNNWSFIASMNTKRFGVSLVAKDDKLYAIGGYDGNSYLSTVEMYNPEKNEWSFVAPMSVAKYYAGAVVF